MHIAKAFQAFWAALLRGEEPFLGKGRTALALISEYKADLVRLQNETNKINSDLHNVVSDL